MAVDRNAAGVIRGEHTIVPASNGGFIVYSTGDICDFSRRMPEALIAGSLDEVLGWLRQRLMPVPPSVERSAA
ncbi:hypothetical protein ABC766_29415 [Methylobacterium fujisawaense]|uniref:hypothetical protein n=1 Tax=Methylobacterium fujisawaense TaxID=107400 RepID=UPI0031F51AF8